MTDIKPIPFNDDILIDVGTERPELGHAYAKAYSAQGSEQAPGSYVAIVCDNGAQPRTRMTGIYNNLVGDYMPRLVHANVIAWPIDQSKRMVFVFDDVLGKPIATTDHGLAMDWKPEKVIETVIKPVIYALKSMRDSDLAHGGIRPTRLFDGGKPALEYALLGECLSAPTSSTQPVLFEPIDRGLAHPLGRGPSSLSDDIYALGVTAAVLMRNKDLLRNPNDADISRAKQELGTFYALMGDTRISGAALEFLRGTLIDHEKDRWTIDNAMAWVEGRRATPRQSPRKKPAQRAYDFCGVAHNFLPVLATEFIRHPNEAASAIESPDLTQWLSRAYNDPETIARLEQAGAAIRDPANKAGGSPDKAAAYAALALDPVAPIRYKELAFMPEGLGQLLCDAIAKNGMVQSFADILQSTLQTFWLTVRDDSYADILSVTQKVEQARSMMRNAHNPGFGLERVLYLLNPDAPCLSPLFKNAYVRTPEDVVIALNEACKQSPKPPRLLDRHIVAFLAERDRKAIEMHIFDINSGKPSQIAMGTLRCLAALQKRSRMDALPELTLWMVELIKPVYATFHDRDLREEVQKKVEKAKHEGRLWRILDILTDPETLARDMALFSNAYREYQSLAQERTMLEMRLASPQTFGLRSGMETATFISSLVAFIVALGLVMVFLQSKNMMGGM